MSQKRNKTKKKKKNKLRAGIVHAYIHANSKIGVMVDLRCQTDFASRSKKFNKLAHDLAMQIAAMGEKKLMEQDFIKDPSKKIKDLLSEANKELGEPIELNQFVRYQIS